MDRLVHAALLFLAGFHPLAPGSTTPAPPPTMRPPAISLPLLQRDTRPPAKLIESGHASWYDYEPTASGRPMRGLCAAHRSLPFGTKVLVIVQDTARHEEAVVTIIDRTGPRMIHMRPRRIIDLGPAARDVLLHGRGLARVSLYAVRK